MSQSKTWSVIASGDRSLSDIEKDIAATGFAVEETLPAIGQITGVASDDVKEKVKAIPGVADVDEVPVSSVGPPDATLTW